MVAMYKGCVLSTCRLRKTNTTAQRTSAVSVPDTRWQVVASTHNHTWTEKLTPSQHFQAVPANCEWQFNTNLLLPRLFFGSLVFASNMSKDWIGLLPTRHQAPTFVFHSHMLRDSADFWNQSAFKRFCRYMGSAHIGTNCTSLRRTLTRIVQPLPRKLPHHRPL